LDLLRRLAEAGNPVVVVEHDPAAMRAADWMVELGPGSGEAGGALVYQGTAAGVRDAGTLTGQYLSGEKRIGVPSARRPARGGRWLNVKGARQHNVRDVDARIPLGTLTAVTGVSGSGKSTLVHDVLFRQLAARLTGVHGAKQHLGEPVGAVRALEGWEAISDVVLVDQAPIGRTPRSNPVTYIKAFDELRALFAAEPLARARGFTASTFSFNVAGGRCETCEGAGHVLIEMVFLANVFVPCDVCGGKRFKKEVLDVKLGGSSIHEVLEWTVDQALARFHRQPRLARALWHLQQVGLGYLRLGQPATTLSGGEAQRLKIARELALASGKARGGGHKLYILDEPTTGLHLDDVRTLCRVLDRLVDAGHTVLVIEHHLDVVKRADWVIEMGPGAGDSLPPHPRPLGARGRPAVGHARGRGLHLPDRGSRDHHAVAFGVHRRRVVDPGTGHRAGAAGAASQLAHGGGPGAGDVRHLPAHGARRGRPEPRRPAHADLRGVLRRSGRRGQRLISPPRCAPPGVLADRHHGAARS